MLQARLDFVRVEDSLFLHHGLPGHGLSGDLSYLRRPLGLTRCLLSSLLVFRVKPRVRPVWLGVGLAGEREGAVLLLVRLVERLVMRLVERLVVRGRGREGKGGTGGWRV